MNVTDKTILLTGASSGIGECLAYQLSARGAKLLLLARDMEKLEKVRLSCTHAERHSCYSVDLFDYHKAAKETEKILAEQQNIDILINNAGRSQRSFAKDTQLDVFEYLMAVDYFAPVAMTKALLAHMIEKQSGQIVTVSSIAGIVATPYRSGYSAAKHAIIGFMDSLRAEIYAENITVTLLCPGFIRTGISVKALTADGTALGSVDSGQANGMPTEKCAKEMIEAIEKDKTMAVMGGKEKYAPLIKRFFPNLLVKIIRKAKVR